MVFSCCSFGPIVPPDLCRTGNLYQNTRVDPKKVTRLIVEGKLCPVFQGTEEPTPLPAEHELYVQVLARVLKKKHDSKESLKLLVHLTEYEPCPICLLHYPSLNTSRCCAKRLCTECYLEVQTLRPGITACPFCKLPGFSAKFVGLRTLESREAERLEEQKVIEARIREREDEIRRDKEREEQRAQQRLAGTASQSEARSEGLPPIATAAQRATSPAPDPSPRPESQARMGTETSTSRRSSTSATAVPLSQLDARALAQAQQRMESQAAARHHHPQHASHSRSVASPQGSTPTRQRHHVSGDEGSSHSPRHPSGHSNAHSRRYQLADYVPGTYAAIALNVDDINDIMLEQAVYESLIANEAAGASTTAAHSTASPLGQTPPSATPISRVSSANSSSTAAAAAAAGAVSPPLPVSHPAATPASASTPSRPTSPTAAAAATASPSQPTVTRVISPPLPPITTRVITSPRQQGAGSTAGGTQGPAGAAAAGQPAAAASGGGGAARVSAAAVQSQLASVATLSEEEQLELAIQLSLAATAGTDPVSDVTDVTESNARSLSAAGGRDQEDGESGVPFSRAGTPTMAGAEGRAAAAGAFDAPAPSAAATPAEASNEETSVVTTSQIGARNGNGDRASSSGLTAAGALAAAVAASQPKTYHVEMVFFAHTHGPAPTPATQTQAPVAAGSQGAPQHAAAATSGPQGSSVSVSTTVEAYVTDVPAQPTRARHSPTAAALANADPAKQGLLLVQNPDGTVCSAASAAPAPAAAVAVSARAGGTAAYEQELLARDRRQLSQVHRQIVTDRYQDYTIPDEIDIGNAEYQDYDVVGFDAAPLEASEMDSTLAADAQVQQSIDARDARLRAAYRR